MVVEHTPDGAIGDADTDVVTQEMIAARLYVAQIERGEDVSGDAALVMLRKILRHQDQLHGVERVLTQHALDQGYTWVDIAEYTGRGTKQAAQQRFSRISGGTVDVTPVELSPAAIETYGFPAWSEPAATPLDVTDWPARQARALIPFERDEQGWPVNPVRRTGRTGRNLPRWGENQAADSIVLAGSGKNQKILLIQRTDNETWALPGGMLDPGEDAEQARVRELYEEAGLNLSHRAPECVWTSYVEDHRASDHSWVVTTIGTYHLDVPSEIAAGDDAKNAAWWPASDIHHLHSNLTEAGGELHRGHSPFIATEFDRRHDH